MRSRNYFLTAIILMMLAQVSMARTDRPGIAITHVDSDVKVIYNVGEQSRAKVVIYDEQRNIVFSETISSSDKGFIRPYDLSKLPRGEYEVSVRNLDGVESKLAAVKNYREEEEEEEMFAKVEPLAGNHRYLLTIANQDNKSVEIEILDESNRQIFRKKKRIRDDYACIFVIKNILPDEALTFHIKNEEAGKYIRVN